MIRVYLIWLQRMGLSDQWIGRLVGVDTRQVAAWRAMSPGYRQLTKRKPSEDMIQSVRKLAKANGWKDEYEFRVNWKELLNATNSKPRGNTIPSQPGMGG